MTNKKWLFSNFFNRSISDIKTRSKKLLDDNLIDDDNRSGELFWDDDDRLYVGEYVHVVNGEDINYLPNGQGKMTYPDGFIYEGDFQNSLANGQGKAEYHGTIDEGEYEAKGILSGPGKRIFPDGKIYDGEFLLNFPNGQGKMTFPDGVIQEGEFLDGDFVE